MRWMIVFKYSSVKFCMFLIFGNIHFRLILEMSLPLVVKPVSNHYAILEREMMMDIEGIRLFHDFYGEE